MSSTHERARDRLREGELARSLATAESLVQLFDTVARLSENDVALRADNLSLTYGELDRLSRELATRLGTCGVGRGVRVALLVQRRPEIVVAILAILRAGGSYVPIDASYPTERRQLMISDSLASVVVAAQGVDVADVENVQTVLVALEFGRLDLEESRPHVEKGRRDLAKLSSLLELDRVESVDEAYVIYTSGSTGVPKGCSVSQGNVVSLLRAALPLFDVGVRDNWLLFHSCTFDFSVWEIWGALSTGATIVVADDAAVLDPAELLALCERHLVTVLCAVPSVFRPLARLLERERRGLEVRYIIFGGERVVLEDVRRAWRFCRPAHRPRMVNMYGITETTVHVTFKEILAEDLDGGHHSSPIGKPLPHLEVQIIGDDGHELPNGVVGEIVVGGAAVSHGYVGRPDLTAERFFSQAGKRWYKSGDLGVRWADGQLGHCGRVDDQVKVRGFRIELGEVESALSNLSCITSAAVVLLDEDGDARIGAVLVADDNKSPAEIRSSLRTTLPPYMVPAHVVLVNELPAGSSGKPDRNRLRELLYDSIGTPSLTAKPTASICRESDCSAESNVDRALTLAEVVDRVRTHWAEALGSNDFDDDEGFFDVGGDSMSIIAVYEALDLEFAAANLTVVDLYTYPSVEEIANRIRRT